MNNCCEVSVPILDRSHNLVNPVGLPTGTVPASKFLGEVVKGKKPEHLGRQSMVKIWDPRYGAVPPASLFFQAVHAAFAEHYPLALRPEVILYLVTSVVAETVKRNPERFRALFTTAQGKQTIEVRHDNLVRGYPESPWHEVFPMFNRDLCKQVPGTLMGYMLPDFSTRTPEVDAATMVTFMDAASPFYDYRVMTKCGIPRIRLLGTTEDWAKVHVAVAHLGKLFGPYIPGYFERILPHVAMLAGQADDAGRDYDFWRSIYKHHSGSGGDTFGGWLADFLYYIQEDGKTVVRSQGSYECGMWKGLTLGCAPSHVSTVPFIWEYFEEEFPMTFAGGILGLDNEDGYLTPALSYAVLNG
jgi:hypothetical protein